ncbi:MAG: SPOR domain-containing protein [Desulfobacterales bacterium]|nr:SPOR domain-containing protein [Desulfobacterales bacterium]
MPIKKTRSKAKKKKYVLELSITSLILWGIVLLFLLAWIFVLGILVGDGFLLNGAKNLKELKGQIAELQDTLSRKDELNQKVPKKPAEDPQFSFHEILSTKKDKVAEKGRAAVKKKVARPKVHKKAAAPVKILETGRTYALQIASYETEIMAARMADRLTKRGYLVYYYHAKINGKPYYRVRCGPFKDRKEAEDLKKLLAKKEGIEGFVTKAEK